CRLGPAPDGACRRTAAQSSTEEPALLIGIGIAIGIAGGAVLALLAVSVFGTTGVSKARRIRDQLLEDAQREGDAVRREAQVEAREQAVRLRSEIDAELTDRRAQVLRSE